MSQTAQQLPYCGRFAPSPTGPLHFGSLVAALASCLDARAHHGTWLLRIEDLDRPRCSGEAAAAMITMLEDFGFEPDGATVWQSRRDEAYVDALGKLQELGHVYPCGCSRRELADSRLGPDGAAIYPGTCRDGMAFGKSGRALRLRVAGLVDIDDRVQGRVRWDLARDCGDFVVRRADDLFAYQLAVVVDDAAAGVTDIVRGADILHSTPRQIALQRLLGLPTPRYAHLPVVTTASGEKLSKQTLAAPVDPLRPVPQLLAALGFLDHEPPAELSAASLAEVWAWGIANWDMSKVQPGMGRPAPGAPASGHLA